MNNKHPVLHRLEFKQVPVGTRFYDPISQEYFVKKSAQLAVMVTGIGDGQKADEFEPDDIVRVEEAV